MRSICMAVLFVAVSAVLVRDDPSWARPAPAAGPVVVIAAADSLPRLTEGQSVRVLPIGAVKAMSASMVRLKEIGSHYHSAHAETIYVIEGSGTLVVGGEKIPAGPGTIALVPAGTPHSFSAEGGTAALVLSVMAPPFDGSDRIFVK